MAGRERLAQEHKERSACEKTGEGEGMILLSLVGILSTLLVSVN